MIRKIFLLPIIFFLLSPLIFARGKADEEEVKTQNDEWILCITNLNTTALEPEKRIVTGVILRRLVENIESINFRTRISSEYAYYEEAAWANKRSTAAKNLAVKQNERSLLLFRGEPDWRYRANLAKLDSEIEKLQAELEEIDKNAPVINKEPVFKLFSGNLSFQFPEAPVSGNEYRFCTSQKADAALIGTISDYHGRFIVTLKLYTIFTRSFVWEERIIFSHEDLESVLEEFSRKLIIVLSGNKPGAVEITAEPEEALVLINRSFAGRGKTDVLEFPPGRITVTAAAPDFESITFETDIAPGELSQISINLKPIEYADVEITGNHKGLSGNVYHGAMYVGEAPLTLRLPVNYLELMELQIESGDKGRIVFSTPDANGIANSINIRTIRQPRQGSVDTARRLYYWSWAGTWASGIAAWISYHEYNNLATAFVQGGSNNLGLYNDTNTMYNVYMGTLIALGAFVALDLILMARYIYVSNRDSTTVRTGK
ncbi:MAG: hypothetical protein LBU88_10535 [Treponema sp.]|nr:hypothetical protein [Treponema sp.]